MGRVQSSPFLPPIPGDAADIGRVVFPGTARGGRGLLSLADRDPNNPKNNREAAGPSSYTKPPTPSIDEVHGVWDRSPAGAPSPTSPTVRRPVVY